MEHTPEPWELDLGGGHNDPSIRGSEAIHTNGRLRNKQGVSSASFSEEICVLRCDTSLPGPAANLALILSAPRTAEKLSVVKAELETARTNLFLQSDSKAELLKALESLLSFATRVYYCLEKTNAEYDCNGEEILDKTTLLIQRAKEK